MKIENQGVGPPLLGPAISQEILRQLAICVILFGYLCLSGSGIICIKKICVGDGSGGYGDGDGEGGRLAAFVIKVVVVMILVVLIMLMIVVFL